MIQSGRCHGPGCRNSTDLDFCCEQHAVAWQAQFWGRPRPEPHPTQADLTAALAVAEQFREVDLAPFRDALGRTVRALAEISELPASLVDPEAPASVDSISVAWGHPAPRSAFGVSQLLADIPPAALALGAGMGLGIAPTWAQEAVEAERLTLAIRAVCPPEHLEEALAEAARRPGGLQSVYDELTRGWLPESADATNQQVAPKDQQVGFLAKWINRVFGRTT